MENKQLLELAAKASGIDLVWSSRGVPLRHDSGNYHQWNPIADDGDAFRLSVLLNLSIYQHQHGCGWVDVGIYKELTGADPLSATRLAIVKAAAHIGKNMTANAELTRAHDEL